MSAAPARAGAAPVTVTSLVDAGAFRREILAEARAGLRARPRRLSPHWFYDARGSRLFEEITRLPEYYPTRREREILVRRAGEIASASGAEVLVELGAGSSEKTRLLLDALRAHGTLSGFAPVDVSEEMLRHAAHALARDYPGLRVHAVVGDFGRHLGALPRGGRRMIAFLGGTIGNFEPRPRARFLRDVAANLAAGDTFLLGTDLVKSRARLEAAYDDAAGVTAAFNRNALSSLNRAVGGDFDPARFRHRAVYDPKREWIEMHLVSTRRQTVRLPGLGLTLELARGEALRTEVSCKFRRARVEAELRRAGMRPLGWWTDGAGDFALSLWGRR